MATKLTPLTNQQKLTTSKNPLPPPLTTSKPLPSIKNQQSMTPPSPNQSLTINTSPIRSIAESGQSGDFAKRNDLLKELLGGIINDYNVDKLNNFNEKLESIIKPTKDDINENKEY
ncbi:MAG: hypothetical protein EBU82_14560, partial [Flavobacteriia bacterium]|nr:hypothetical protein [Flavobacteriia bacterium]